MKESNNKKYCLNTEEFEAQLKDPSMEFAIDDADLRTTDLDDLTSKFNEKQERAFNIITDHLSDEDSSQMIMFLSGPGGSGLLVVPFLI